MIFNDITLNNIVNFNSSYLLIESLKNEELIDEFSLFAFKKSRKELMLDIGATMVAPKDAIADESINFPRKVMVETFENFLDFKGINKNNILVELEILKSENVKSSAELQRKYKINQKRASKIFKLFNCLM